MQVLVETQSIDCNGLPTSGTACRSHVAPPSAEIATAAVPTTAIVDASTVATCLGAPIAGRVTGFHDVPRSVVAYATALLAAVSTASPASAVVKTAPTGAAPPPPGPASVPGRAVCLAKLWPPSVVRRTLPSTRKR